MRAAYCRCQSKSQGDEPAPGSGPEPWIYVPFPAQGSLDVQVQEPVATWHARPLHVNRSALLCTSPRLPAGTTVPPQHTHPGTAQGTVWPLPTSWMWHYALYMVPQAETG